MLRWLRKPFREVEDAYRQAIVLLPNERGFMKEVEEVGQPRRSAHGRRRPSRIRDSGHGGVRTLPMRSSIGDAVLSWKVFGPGAYRCWPSALGAHVGAVLLTVGSRRSVGRAGQPQVAPGPLVETKGKLPDNVLALV